MNLNINLERPSVRKSVLSLYGDIVSDFDERQVECAIIAMSKVLESNLTALSRLNELNLAVPSKLRQKLAGQIAANYALGLITLRREVELGCGETKDME